MADSYATLNERFRELLSRAFEENPDLHEVDILVAENAAEEAARIALSTVKWSRAAGDCYTTSDLVARWDVSRQAIAKRVVTGSLIGLPGKTTTYFPQWQFDDEGRDVRPVVRSILKVFKHYLGRPEPELVASWAATPQPELEGEQPRSWMLLYPKVGDEQLMRCAHITAKGLSR